MVGKFYTPVDLVLEIDGELTRQNDKWGEQNHSDGTGSTLSQMTANSYKAANDAAVQKDTLTWSGILLEEVYEALAEKDHGPLREELVQVAAVAAQWILAIDRADAAQG